MTTTITRERLAEFDRWAKARNGNDYGYGGAFTDNPDVSTDCSGLVLQTAAFLRGRRWQGNRFGSTESFRLNYLIVFDLGFKRMPGNGRPPIESVMLVGLQHGGGGVYSHTACTVNGMNWESRGDGVYYGPRARAWNDRLFHDFWYLDTIVGAPTPPAVNEIDAEARRAAAWLGKRVSVGEVGCPDKVGRFAQFDHGYIYFSPKVRADKAIGDRAIAVPRDIFETWAALKFEAGPLGYPIARHLTTADGTIQAFQNGAIYRQFGKPGVWVHGAILDRYKALKFEAGPLGWPTATEVFTGDGTRTQAFEHGSAAWHPSGVVTTINPKES